MVFSLTRVQTFTMTIMNNPILILSALNNANTNLLFSQNISLGAFHYAKDSRNFVWNSNGKVCFGFF